MHTEILIIIFVWFYVHMKVLIFRKLTNILISLHILLFKMHFATTLSPPPPQIHIITIIVKCILVFKMTDCFLGRLNDHQDSHHCPVEGSRKANATTFHFPGIYSHSSFFYLVRSSLLKYVVWHTRGIWRCFLSTIPHWFNMRHFSRSATLGDESPCVSWVYRCLPGAHILHTSHIYKTKGNLEGAWYYKHIL